MSDTPLISILHPTRRVTPSAEFPNAWVDSCRAYLERCEHPEWCEYLLIVHESRWEEYLDNRHRDPFASLDVSKWRRFEVVVNRGRDCVVDQINAGAAAATGDLLTGTQDDYFPPEHWDTEILKALVLKDLPRADQILTDLVPELNYPETLSLLCQESVVLHMSSGNPRDEELMVANAITRARYEQLGYGLDPEFESMFADNWFALRNKRDAEAGLTKIVKRFDIQFEHRREHADEAYAQQNRTEAYMQGHATYMKKAHGTEVILFAMPGENFRAEIFWAHTDLMMWTALQGPRYIVQRLGQHTSNVYHTRIELAERIVESVPRPDYVMWVDDDNIVTPQQFDMLHEDLVEHPELDGVVGWCWCDVGQPQEDGSYPPPVMSCGRQTREMVCLRFTLADQLRAKESGTWLITSDDIAKDGHYFWSGFPCVLIRGEAHAKLGWEAFKPIVRPDVKRGFTSEDTSFFWAAAQAGLKFGVDLRVKIPHGKFRAIEPQFIPASEKLAAREAIGELEVLA